VLAADQVAEAPEHQRAEWAYRKPRRKPQQREDECGRRVDARKERGADVRRE
jgi:hypothetical protein